VSPGSDALTLFKVLTSEERILVAAAIISDLRTPAEVAECTGLPQRQVVQHLGMMEHYGLAVADDSGRYRFSRRPLVDALKSLEPATLGPDLDESVDEFDRKVLSTFLIDGKLGSIPTQQKKRDAVLRFLAKQFEPGRMYDEREINAVLRPYHPDVASLRRYMVDGGFLQRQVIHSIAADALGSPDASVQHTVQYWKPDGGESE